ncbi:T9SS type A sorting domain-containing protein [Flavobacterium sp. NST-5]|uniref:T9SS type A sorting domain-containing protein n=1 Tax=Flavobacterium ichthyis TaxID=2698827 RepID=A0ABW9ZG77_9FLAO|nr:T9SS type A sorting domain-containing protein [Flavobacterium ichthyis]NBL66105.1 T9SS type A sorting domain-containing protein [Flavobacterium ichthyis]
MKKLYTLLFTVALGFAATAQNLVVNPTFNDGLNGWSAGPIASYTAPTLVAADGSDGSNSAQYVATATTGFFQDVPVTAGNTLKISFRYKATGDGTDARIWSNYKDAAGTIIYQAATNTDDPLRNNNGYLPAATDWTLHEITVVAPANVTVLTLAVRAYNGGTVAFDQFSVEDMTMSVKENNIAGLKVYPNPVTGGKFFISTDANTTKSVAIFDVLGKQVVNTTATETVNVANLKAGVYIVKITEEGKTATRKLVIK